jgi:hypothetical protein
VVFFGWFILGVGGGVFLICEPWGGCCWGALRAKQKTHKQKKHTKVTNTNTKTNRRSTARTHTHLERALDVGVHHPNVGLEHVERPARDAARLVDGDAVQRRVARPVLVQQQQQLLFLFEGGAFFCFERVFCVLSCCFFELHLRKTKTPEEREGGPSADNECAFASPRARMIAR